MLTTREDAAFIQAMQDAVAEKGTDHVYPNEDKIDYMGVRMCQYFDKFDGRPLCLIGVALSKLGLSADELTFDEQTSSAARIMRILGFSTKMGSAAQAAQSEQDRGEKWGDALTVFNEKVGING